MPGLFPVLASVGGLVVPLVLLGNGGFRGRIECLRCLASRCIGAIAVLCRNLVAAALARALAVAASPTAAPSAPAPPPAPVAVVVLAFAFASQRGLLAQACRHVGRCSQVVGRLRVLRSDFLDCVAVAASLAPPGLGAMLV